MVGRVSRAAMVGMAVACLGVTPVASYAAQHIPTTPTTTHAPERRHAPTPAPHPTHRPSHAPRPTHWPVAAGDRGPLVDLLQQRLLWLGYPVKLTHVVDRATAAAVSRFRDKWFFGSGTTTTAAVWAKLAQVTRAEGSLPSTCRTSGIVLCVDKTSESLRLVRDGVVTLTADARFGGVGFETREGVFRVYRKSRDHVSTEYHTPMPFAMFFSGGQAVHYSPFFHRDGYNGHSHGCVNLRDLTVASYLFDVVPVGTRVVVYRS